MDVRSRRVRETSPDRAKVCLRPKVKPMMKKVQVVYYLSRNGLLEHPHYMEVAHLADQPLRLRDVMDRLTILRGKGMPSLYSWSCKRSYKNGYVWNDLAENDIICPTEGAEYVLKGSELVEGCSEKLQQMHVSSARQQQQQQQQQHIQELNFQQRQKPKYEEEDRDYDEEEEEQEQEEEEEYEVELDEDQKTSYTSSTTPHSRCSRGVSTDELEEPQAQQTQAHKTPSEPITAPPNPSSDDSPSIMTTANKNRAKQSNNRSRRFNDDDPGAVSESGPGRNSVLLQIIACGSSAVAKAKSSPPVAVKSSSNNGNALRRGVLCKSAAKMVDEEMINYMSENPRFGNPQAEEKEYFSGSIVESMTEDRAGAVPSVLKKSNSYNEERSGKAGLEELTHVDEEKREKAKTTGRCIPRKRSSASSKQESKKC